jgi:(p)ppGpp synthase/HD superfamily hydrolase
MNLKRAGLNDEAILCAAVLHDVVEDTGATLKTVTNIFGADVGRWVDQVSSKPDETFSERLTRLGSADWPAQAIKCADIISNCSDLPALAPQWAATYLPKKAREVAVLSRAPVNLWREADIITRLDRLVIG